MKKLGFLFILLSACMVVQAQDAVGINNDSPDASAILDVASTSQGMLVPRMTSGQRDLISSPAQGLLIYNTTTNTFWFFNNSAWTEIISSVSSDEITDADGDTRVEVEQTVDDDIIRFTMRGTEYFRMEEGRMSVLNTGNSIFMGPNAGRSDDRTENRNIFIGNNAGRLNTVGQNNIGIGYRASRNNVDGEDNIAIGEDALLSNSTGSSNIAIGSNALTVSQTNDSNLAVGYNSLTSLITGTNNTSFGYNSMRAKTRGFSNVAIGSGSLQNNLLGDENTAIGRNAGSNSTGSGNVFIGYTAGRDETGDNKLYIDNSSTTAPLIWGDFSTDSLVVNGNLSVTEDITYVGTLTDVSDRRLKEDFDTLKKVMHLVNQLQAYSYKMISNESNEREFGLIAQEVEQVFPEMVKVIDKEKGYIGVNYLQMIAILVEGLKEQQNLIDEYELRQNISSDKLNSLKAEVKSIKETLNIK